MNRLLFLLFTCLAFTRLSFLGSSTYGSPPSPCQLREGAFRLFFFVCCVLNTYWSFCTADTLFYEFSEKDGHAVYSFYAPASDRISLEFTGKAIVISVDKTIGEAKVSFVLLWDVGDFYFFGLITMQMQERARLTFVPRWDIEQGTALHQFLSADEKLPSLFHLSIPLRQPTSADTLVLTLKTKGETKLSVVKKPVASAKDNELSDDESRSVALFCQ